MDTRLPRKIKKLFKNNIIDRWEKFLEEKEAYKEREKHIDEIFTRNYTHAWKIFHSSIRQEVID